MHKSTQKHARGKTLLAAVFWVLVWQAASVAVGQALFLPSPWQVAQALWGMLSQSFFWRAVGTSLWRIGLGFALGLGLGVALAAGAAASRFLETLLRPLLLLVKAVPVASFVILALVWLSSRALSTFIGFLMVLPVVYTGTLAGLQSADTQLLEMARVFRLPFWRRVRGIYLPAALPQTLAACELALGLCWKSGVAAEVIGLPGGTIGEKLFGAKINLQTAELFAWTIVIVLLSWGMGRLVLAGLRALARKAQGGVRNA